MRAEPLARADPVLVDHAQRPKAHVLWIVVITERERVPAVEPPEVGGAALFRMSYVDHSVRSGDARWAAARYSWISATAAAPSPIAAPTRFTEPERTSPTANTPGTLDSSDITPGATLEQALPVSTKPCESSTTPQPLSQSVSGSAPTNRTPWRIGRCSPRPFRLSRQ